MKANIYEQDVDMMWGRKVQERSSKIARDQRVVAQILNYPLKGLENENIIFHDKNDGHQ